LQELEALQDEKDLFFARLEENEAELEMWLFLLEEEQILRDAELGIAQQAHQRELDERERQRRAAEAAARRAAAAQRDADNAARRAALNMGVWYWPVENHFTVSSHFGNRPNPFNRSRTQFHGGTDVPAPTGTRIFAMQEGYVIQSGWNGGFGNSITIDHANGYRTLYAHNSRNRVSVGDFVHRGQHIADVGSTGQSTGPHLHFETIRNGQRLDPMSFFPR
jgi:murein DD-endopeptidase MepM/ murein hydrolase activator NlpD